MAGGEMVGHGGSADRDCGVVARKCEIGERVS